MNVPCIVEVGSNWIVVVGEGKVLWIWVIVSTSLVLIPEIEHKLIGSHTYLIKYMLGGSS